MSASLRHMVVGALLLALCAVQALAQVGTWAAKAPMETQLFQHAASVLDGIVYEVGGVTNGGYPTPLPAWTGAYDPGTNSWSKRAPLNRGRAGHAAVASGEKIYAIGGGTGDGYVGATEVYDPSLGTWSLRASIPTLRQDLTAQAVNGIIYAIGGTTGRHDNEAYNTAADTWATKTPMPSGRQAMGSAMVEGVIYVIGGYTPTGIPLGTVEAYDPAHDTWTTKAPMPTARGYPGVAAVNGIIYVIGGEVPDADGHEIGLDTVEAYDPAHDTWTAQAPMPTARSRLATATAGGVIYATGGQLRAWSYYATNEAFTPEAETNNPPTANAGPDQVVSADADCQANVNLDGSASVDPDGDTLTYTWTGPFGTASEVSPTVPLGLGAHSIILDVDDGQGCTSTDSVVVIVKDTTAPAITGLLVSPAVLWPPDHKMVAVSVSAASSDNCRPAPTCKIISVSSNEPIDGLGDGDTSPDWEITGNLKLNLRAERSGKGAGRVYTMTVQCTDASGNMSNKTISVSVPLNKKGN